ncbi:hypothetical protein GW17_00039775 [Ensete ventricosum]|nr:hypothetical protein GW17_00039775 [Ensete ventricosum]
MSSICAIVHHSYKCYRMQHRHLRGTGAISPSYVHELPGNDDPPSRIKRSCGTHKTKLELDYEKPAEEQVEQQGRR